MMARQHKSGLDYFSLDVNMDDKIRLIEAKYGITGFGVVIKLWQKIYNDGYFIEWTEERQLLFGKDINVDINTINAIINDCLRWKIFDQIIFDKYSVLTSKGIQKRFILASERRKEIELVEDYWLISRDIKANKNGEPRVTWINVYINPVNVDIGTQSKVKESKVKESIEPPIVPLGDVHEKPIDFKKIVDRLNELAGTNYRATSKTTRDKIIARVNEGFTVSDMITVVEKMCFLWNRDPPKGGKDMRPYLRPETLFGGKFEGYLNAPVRKKEVDPLSFAAFGLKFDEEGAYYDDERGVF
ncbi:MAG: DUF4373 domain-containing protein [Peptococcaceae bacterium]|nr:DUF4373 domain-containing protein [Peptococcaceae bacterium]